MKKWLGIAGLLVSSFAYSNARIEVMMPAAGDYIGFVRSEVVPVFKEMYPDVDVVVTNDENVETRMAAGDLPNVYAGVFGFQPARYAKLGQLKHFEDFDGYEELVDRIDPQFMRKNFGRDYYIPWNVTTQLMIYNKDLFREAGLDPDSPPSTWAEFIDAAEKISQLPARADGSPVYGTVLWNEVLSSGSWYWSMLAQLYYNFNQGEYSLLNRFGTHPVFDHEDAHMAEFFATMAEVQQYAPMTMEKNFFSRTIGMWPQFGFGWKTNLVEAAGEPMEIGVDVGLASLPTRNAGDTPFSTLDGRALMIFKDSEEIEELSWRFVQLLMDDDMNHKANMVLGQLPVLDAIKDRDYYQTPEAQPFVKQLENIVMAEPFAQTNDIAGIILDEYAKVVIRKEYSAEVAVEKAAERSKKILARK